LKAVVPEQEFTMQIRDGSCETKKNLKEMRILAVIIYFIHKKSYGCRSDFERNSGEDHSMVICYQISKRLTKCEIRNHTKKKRRKCTET
jgi:predicted alpha/beta superfamily hydrolase